jgi:hypothetical protein
LPALSPYLAKDNSDKVDNNLEMVMELPQPKLNTMLRLLPARNLNRNLKVKMITKDLIGS